MSNKGHGSTTSAQCSWIYSVLPREVAVQLSDSLRRRFGNAIPWSSPRKRSESASSATSAESCFTTLVNTRTSTPRLNPRDRFTEQLSTATLATETDASPESPIVLLSKQDEAAAIDWPAVAVGVNLSQAALGGRASMDPAVRRAMLLDGLKYMVGALPDDLTEREVDMVKEFLPAPLLLADSAGGFVPRKPMIGAKTGSENVLRSGTGRLVCFLISVFVLIIPIFTSLLSRALDYERQHRLTEKTIHGTGQLAKGAASVSVSAADSLIGLGQTPLGSQCLYSMRWVLRSIFEGVGDGVDRSMQQRKMRPSLDSLKMLL